MNVASWRSISNGEDYLKALNEKIKFKRDYMSKQITKKELFAALEGYPDDARIFFNDDDNHCVIHINRIDYEDDDLMPVLSPDPGGPMIFIHFQKKCGNVE